MDNDIKVGDWVRRKSDSIPNSEWKLGDIAARVSYVSNQHIRVDPTPGIKQANIYWSRNNFQKVEGSTGANEVFLGPPQICVLGLEQDPYKDAITWPEGVPFPKNREELPDFLESGEIEEGDWVVRKFEWRGSLKWDSGEPIRVRKSPVGAHSSLMYLLAREGDARSRGNWDKDKFVKVQSPFEVMKRLGLLTPRSDSVQLTFEF